MPFRWTTWIVATFLVLGWASAHAQPADPLAPPESISADSRVAYEEGRLIFNAHWRPSGTDGPDDFEGLGPLYNRIACSSCHNAGGRGAPPDGPERNFLTALVRIGIVADDGTVAPHPEFGVQIQDRAVPGVEPEADLSLTWVPVDFEMPDGTVVPLRRPDLRIVPDPGENARWSIRVAPPVRGVGALMHAVTANRGEGRFGWKATEPTLAAQNASALSQDMGITSAYEPDAVCPSGLDACGGGDNEVSGIRLFLLSHFLERLPPPEPVSYPEPMGLQLFADTGCADCHMSALPTEDGIGDLAAYTDLALHDMGPGLDDGLPEGEAASFEWRTPPLWGLGSYLAENPDATLLHDGRARGLLEAILWHDGEARQSRDSFLMLAPQERQRLVDFLMRL